ncbi:copper amine oxidase domain-containing protein [Haloferax mucosum ATCC BAA-1512]|uniref:Copper amine oxidase domain-containing protein n=1 Tax=Haloferax mucosum ATCC BAA-1512 TaxID=662479 RepID=M0IHI7_9EURY|nr:hypothetical protein [Haloferax mucosum]ELZ94924.1 copper amine oxidase domain-containing protein [Haloferax mucosum ATCC BAA-1512]
MPEQSNPTGAVGPASRLSRRHLVRGLCGLSLVSLAGCTSSPDAEPTDTDGDGVIDSEDYAPRDANVSRRLDLESASATGTATPTLTATPKASHTPTPTTPPTPTATPTTTPSSPSETEAESETETDTDTSKAISSNALSATNPGVFDRRNYIARYSHRGAEVVLRTESVDGYDVSDRDLTVSLVEFPRGREFTRETTSLSIPDGASSTTETVGITFPSAAEETRVHYIAALVPEGTSLDDATADEIDLIAETDPFRWDADRKAIRRDKPPTLAAIGGESGDGYRRVEAEGVFDISIVGRTAGRQWEAPFYVYKSAYMQAVNRDHGRRRPEFVQFEMQSGFIGGFASILDELAVSNGFTEKRETVEFVIDFVQRLPYVPDDVSTGFDDFTKFSVETLVGLGGDCEDTSIMLAGLLQSEPFGYDMVLIQPPGHMAVGIYGTDLPGTYWTLDDRDYYYIETTGEGWGIGDIPDEYKDDRAYVHQV